MSIYCHSLCLRGIITEIRVNRTRLSSRFLRIISRTIDTATRYGGDEFALILPETGMKAGQEVARRICNRMVGDAGLPSLSASVGVAVFAQDGETLEASVGAADKALYKTKGRISWKLSLAV